MGYQAVDKVPSRLRYGKRRGEGRKKTELQLRVEEFIDMNVKAAEFVDWSSYYVSLKSAQNTITRRCQNKNQSYPVKAIIRDGKLYLERTDM